jgi:predicted ATP-dependent serine protease
VMFLEKRIKEAEKMWFEALYIPKIPSTLTQFLPKNSKLKIIELSHISELVKYIS